MAVTDSRGAAETSAAPRPAAGPPDDGRRRLGVPWRALTVLGSTAFLVGVWWLVAALRIWDPVFVPSPAAVADELVRTSTVHDGIRGYSGHLLHEHLWVSLRRILLGSAIGAAIGVPLGLLVGGVRVARWALEPGLTFLRQLPPLAYFSLLIIWLGIDESPKVWLLVIAAMPPVAVATATAVGGVHRDFVNGARSLGASRWQVTLHVVLPASLPEIFTGIRLGVGVAYTSVVAAETVNGVPGIGGMIRDAQRYNQTDVVILGIIVLGLSGIALDAILRWVQNRATPWRGVA
ncbi:ABC transporter permease [Frankia sp. CNm7]|uniref:ABC transporter permease n=1 Tax=Frankia nepalensis TaxID=1836974 RepID=A0A937UQ00_9ACTN|nr:ABC transporter permease [Frankia nepalensis]MBL7497457.1 ABC transporter permease [Frankia nepalensis]MBL7514707.1 ABC transporter permease [Frankia nepalensis]MBL7520131.1 ABC transporter permease [Frankia nepalensis]MBL7629593.1 ABC transporter permease [Frankia nepalensis]